MRAVIYRKGTGEALACVPDASWSDYPYLASVPLTPTEEGPLRVRGVRYYLGRAANDDLFLPRTDGRHGADWLEVYVSPEPIEDTLESRVERLCAVSNILPAWAPPRDSPFTR